MDLQEDVTVVQGGVVELDEDVDFLFNEQIIQDEGPFHLEKTDDQVIVELAEINANILGNKISYTLRTFLIKFLSVFFIVFLLYVMLSYQNRSGHQGRGFRGEWRE